ncbi:MAG: hypothetical protein GVY19_01200 [Bacteroidetes bacterium]|jgi:DNA-binding CsgD family transcriptional regulator|nr:hypothetical protein [Bacteroidota bacterium]
MESIAIKKLITDCGIIAGFSEFPDIHQLIHYLSNHSPQYIFIHQSKITPENLDNLNMYNGKSESLCFIKVGESQINHTEKLFRHVLDTQKNENEIMKQIVHIFEPVQPATRLIEATGLSQREIDILKQVALGMTNKEISEHLHISMHTVITHRKNITAKLGIKTIAGLTIYAVLNNIINPEDVEM